VTAPLYKTIAETLRAEIAAGRLGVGDAAPTEHALAAHYGVSRHTAREALRLLAEEGLVQRRRGAGTFVAAAPKPAYVQPIGSIEDILQYARDVVLVVETWGPAPAPPDLSAIAPGVAFWRLTGARRTPQGDVAALTEVWVRADLAPPRSVLDTLPGAILPWIEATYGVRAAKVRQILEAESLPREACVRFGLTPPAAGLTIRRSYLDPDGRVIQHARSVHPEGRFTYAVDLDRA
jgi:DNA-binding GntR family transcriptional regulator